MSEKGMDEVAGDTLAKVEACITAMHNAFGYYDDPSDPAWSAEAWGNAARAARDLSEQADRLGDLARDVARTHEDAAYDVAPSAETRGDAA